MRTPLLVGAALGLLGRSFPQESAQSLSQQGKKESVRALLKSLETRDPKPSRIINLKDFVQHDPQIEDGVEGFRRWAARLPSDTRVNTIRMFADGDYVVAQSEFNIAGPTIGFDIFKFEKGQIVEHWDNIEAKCPQPNGSGRTQIDGPTKITDLDKTDANKALAKEYFEVVVIGGNRDRAVDYRDQFHQHNCYGEDNKSGLQTKQGPFAKPGFVYKVEKVHMVLGEGSSVLVVNEGLFDNTPTSFTTSIALLGGRWSSTGTCSSR
jgi:predicted SnoaL-like aldol condensation-catalyzing enzyme